MNKNNIYIVEIKDIDNFGNGIARIDNVVIFIKGVLLNEKVKIKIIDIKKRYSIGEVIEIIKPNKERENVLCNNYYQCGGCNYLHLSCAKENQMKYNIIKDLFKDYKVNNIDFDDDMYYRNKVIFHIKNNKIGFYKKNSNELVEINNCLLLDKNILEVYQLIKKINLDNLKKIMIKCSSINEIMLVFDNGVSNKDLKYLITNNNQIKSIYINDKLIYGNSYIKSKVNNITYTINPKSFMQVNTNMMIKLYDKIKELAGYNNSLLDLYCGTGTIAIYLKDNYKNIDGVEIVKDAIKNANLNKKINNINNINFICGDASIIKENNYDIIIVDPPRSGLSNNVINNLINIKTNKIIYVSCNYKTLKKDIDLLKEQYSIIEINIFNMFPKTNNIECLVLLQRKKE